MLWRRMGLLISTLLLSSICLGQNLVFNPSFEDYNNCPDQWGDIIESNGWNGPLEGVELFHSCSQDFNVPSNWLDFQYAYDGLAYAGLVVYENQIDSLDYREFIFGNLTQSLTIGTKYYVSFQVNLAISGPANYNCCASNKIGIRFSNNPTSKQINNISHVYTDVVIMDSINWVSIRGSFIADSAYSYLSIGNFWEDSFVSSDTINNQGYLSYYFVDNVCVSTDSTTCFSTLGINENSNSPDFEMFPNPTSNFVEFKFHDFGEYFVKISDFTGKIVEEKVLTKELNTINLEHLLNGLYIVVVNYQVFKRLIINR